jgi:hypothetical protein
MWRHDRWRDSWETGPCQFDSANKIFNPFLLAFLLLTYYSLSRLSLSPHCLFLEVLFLNKDETPFAPLYWDRYEQMKSSAAR